MNLQRYEARLRLLPCVVCVALGVKPPGRCEELHHVGDPATERTDWARVPLCEAHHQGPEGVHGMHRRRFVRATKLSDVTLLAIMHRLFVGDLP